MPLTEAPSYVIYPIATVPGAQFAVGGPIGDSWGAAARERLKELAAAHPGHVWNGAGQYVSGAAKDRLVLAADFCLCPSRFEPCGLVDIEFGWQACRMPHLFIDTWLQLGGTAVLTLDLSAMSQEHNVCSAPCHPDYIRAGHKA